MLPVRADEMTMKTLTDNSPNIMKKYLFYIVALTAAACLLAGCRKDKSGPSDSTGLGPSDSTGLGTALDNAGSANCYIVSDAGKYSFSAVKGNGKKPIGNIASVEVLWETFGTDTAPQPGDLIAEVSYSQPPPNSARATP